MNPGRNLVRPLVLALAALGSIAGAHAAQVRVTVNVENLAAANSVTFAPLRLGFHSGTFDSFNLGQAATAGIISVAEGGSGAAWFPAFMASDPGAVLGSVAGALLPGTSASNSFVVDTAVNPFFSFGSMVVPSNDFFVGNDDPRKYRLFDAAGQLSISSITQRSRDVWDAGSEIFDPAAAAFVGNNGLRADQNSVVALNFAELAAFNGLQTAAGYTFSSQLAADTEIYRISFETAPVPEPETYALMATGLAFVAWAGRRRKRKD